MTLNTRTRAYRFASKSQADAGRWCTAIQEVRNNACFVLFKYSLFMAGKAMFA